MSQFDTSADRGWIAYHLRSCEECRPVEPESGLWVVGAGTQARLVLPGVTPVELVARRAHSSPMRTSTS